MGLMGSVTRGVAAATFGILAMDLLWYLRYRAGGGQSRFVDWELSVGLDNWEHASAPGKVGRLVYETTTSAPLGAEHAALANNVMHWEYGLQWGAVLGMAIGSGRVRPISQGLLLGLLVRLASYVSLPIAGVYKPIWAYDAKTLWDDLSAHLVYGLSTACVFRLLGR